MADLQERALRARSWLTAETHALPLDLFRILAGSVCFAAFVRNLIEVPEFGAAGALVDHALGARIGAARDPFIRMSLFQPGMPDAAVYALYAAGAACALAVVLGIGVRGCSVAMWLIAVSAYRFNYLIANVDDYGLNVVMFWLALLPLGRTLTLPGVLREGRAALTTWVRVRVPGLVVRLFLINVAIMYFVAGMLKWTSAYWRDGFALFAVLRMPIASDPNLVTANNGLLVAGTYVSLVLEPLVPLVMSLPHGNRIKFACLPLVLGLHLGIASTLRIPLINLALIGVTMLYFRGEIAERAQARWGRPVVTPLTAAAAAAPGRPDSRAYLGCAAIALLLLHFLGRPLGLSPEARVLVGRATQLAGIEQDYALFNWVDVRAQHWVARAVIREDDAQPRPLPMDALWPNSVRSMLMLSYQVDHGWMSLADVSRDEFNAEVRTRTARRFCAARSRRALVTADVEIRRTTPGATPDPARVVPLLRFACSQDGGFELVENDESRRAAES